MVVALKNNGEEVSLDKNSKVLKSKSVGTFSEVDNKKSVRKAEKLEKKRLKEEERKIRKASKDASSSSRNRSRSKSNANNGDNTSPTVSPLEKFVQLNGNPVPLFIQKCTEFIEKEGVDMEGIYRVPGNRAHVDTLLQKFDESKFEYLFCFCKINHDFHSFRTDPDISIEELDIQVNAVATALKDFFTKRLPPIFNANCMAEIADIAKEYHDNESLDHIYHFLHSLPRVNFEIIAFMVAHFVK